MTPFNYTSNAQFTLAQEQIQLLCANEEEFYTTIHNLIANIIKRKGAFLFEAFFASPTFKRLSCRIRKYAQSKGDAINITTGEARQALANYVYNEVVEYLNFETSCK